MTKVFRNCLGLASAEKPVIIFLDALDQLSDTENGRQLHWLPTDLPQHVKIIVSSLPELKDQLSKTKITDSTFRIEHLIIRTVSHQF